MPPVTKSKAKTRKENKEKDERQKRILAAQERILKIKRSILAIVEAMIDKEVPKEWFLINCVKLCHADYDDVIQERSIEHLCGYPLCSNTMKQTLKQKYHISRVTNKVYDITERKCFCSNQCYKASNYLKVQLSSVPLYMRKDEENIKIQLLSASDNRGSAGEEIVFHHTIPKEEIEVEYSEKQAANNLQNILNEEIKKCSDSLSDLKIKERVFEKPYFFCDQAAKQKETRPDDSSESDINNELDSDDSGDEKLFPDHDNLLTLTDKHMPIPVKFKKSLLISPLNPNTRPGLPAQQLSLDFIFNVFKDWMTEDTMKYLLGEKYVYGIKADHLFEKMTSDPIVPEKLASIKNEYIELCCKIDSLQDDDLSDSTEIDLIYDCERASTSKTGDNVGVSSSKKVFKARPKSKFNNKRVSFDSNTKSEDINVAHNHALAGRQSGSPVDSSSENKKASTVDSSSENKKASTVDSSSENKKASTVGNSCQEKVTLNFGTSNEAKSSNMEENIFLDNAEETATDDSVPESGFPLVDSVSQNALRRQVITSKLKSVYINLLPIIGLHYTDIRQDVKKFVDTLSLTPTNIVYKPKEWKLISLILLRILTRTVLKDIHDEDQLLKLCVHPIMPITINLKELEKLVHDIISPEIILTLPMLIH